MSKPEAWTVTITFTEDDDKTCADAALQGAPDALHGWGRSRRNPMDPDRPAIGERVAAARALSDLAHHLLDRAAMEIEDWEGRQVTIHS